MLLSVVMSKSLMFRAGTGIAVARAARIRISGIRIAVAGAARIRNSGIEIVIACAARA